MTDASHPNATVAGQRGGAAPRHAALRAGLPDAGDVAEALRRDGLPARRAGLPVGLSRGVVRVDPGHRQAGPGHGLQRPGHRRQLRRPRVASGSRPTTRRSTPSSTSTSPDGPVVIEIPPGAIVGLLDDFWQRSLADVGLPGPDGRQRRQVPPAAARLRRRGSSSGYHVLQATMHNHNLLVRGIIVDNDVRRRRRARSARSRSIPWSERDEPDAEQVRLDLGQADRHDSSGRHRVLGATGHGHRQQPGAGARPVLHGHAQAARHREGQAVPA